MSSLIRSIILGFQGDLLAGTSALCAHMRHTSVRCSCAPRSLSRFNLKCAWAVTEQDKGSPYQLCASTVSTVNTPLPCFGPGMPSSFMASRIQSLGCVWNGKRSQFLHPRVVELWRHDFATLILWFKTGVSSQEPEKSLIHCICLRLEGNFCHTCEWEEEICEPLQ